MKRIECHNCLFFEMAEYWHDVFFGNCLLKGEIENSVKKHRCKGHVSMYDLHQIMDSDRVEKLKAILETLHPEWWKIKVPKLGEGSRNYTRGQRVAVGRYEAEIEEEMKSNTSQTDKYYGIKEKT